MEMKIVIPAKQLNSREFSTDVVVDNKYTQVKCQQYIVTKTSKQDEEGNPIVVNSENITATNTFEAQNNSVKNNIFVMEGKRVETFYTTGTVVISTTKNISKINNSSVTVNGIYKKGVFVVPAEQVINDSNWTINTQADFGNKINFDPSTSFSSKLNAPITYGVTLSDDSFVNIDKIEISDSNTVITCTYKILTKTTTYHYKTGVLTGFNSVQFYEGETFTLDLSIEEIVVEEDKDTISTFGEGNNTYTIESNELYQKENTYNNQMSMAEYNANEIIKRFKNGAKSTSFDIKTKNLLTTEGFTLEKQVLAPKDQIIPYYINKYNKEVPFGSNDKDKKMVFVVSSNEVNYDNAIIQNIEAVQKTYYDLTIPQELQVTRNNLEIFNYSRVYDNDNLIIKLSDDVASDITTENTCLSVNNSSYAPFINNEFAYVVGGDTDICLFAMTNELSTTLSVDNYILENTDYSSNNGEGFSITSSITDNDNCNVVGRYVTNKTYNYATPEINKSVNTLQTTDFVKIFTMPEDWSCFTIYTIITPLSTYTGVIFNKDDILSGDFHNLSWKIENNDFYISVKSIGLSATIKVFDYQQFVLSIEPVSYGAMKELQMGASKDMKLQAELNKTDSSSTYNNLSFAFFNGASEKFLEIKIDKINKVGGEIV